MTPEETKAHKALSFVIPLLEKHELQWEITGGFACYVYGVERPITDIDIDILGSKNDAAFLAFMEEVAPYVTQPLEHFVDQNYDNYNFEMKVEGQLLDICPTQEMNIFNKEIGTYENFYKDGFPRPELQDFFGLKLPLMSKELVIKNKTMLVWQRDSDRRDIEGLRAIKS